jgi:hypothetical protein
MAPTRTPADGVRATTSETDLSVDAATVLRPATHAASGSLYGVTETIPANVTGLIAPLSPAVFRNPARGGSGNQHPFGAAIPVAQRLAGVTSAKVSVDLADMLPGWPYQWPGMTSWLAQVTSFIQDKKASGVSNWYGIEPWNEPDGTWQAANGDFNSTLWRQTVATIRSADPTFKVVGPCYSYYNHATMSTFLTYAKANNCLPDIISWHELSGIANLANNLKDYRALEASLGITALPISINEYCDADHTLEGQPGSAAEFIGKFERYKVDSAEISWWFVPLPGRLGSLLATDTQKGAGWYFFNWYGSMLGNMVSVTPPNEASNQVDGAASVDTSGKTVSLIFGGQNGGSIGATFTNLPSFLGSSVVATVEKVDWVSKDTVSTGPTTVAVSTMAVANGQVKVVVPGTNGTSGYRIRLTPGTSGVISGKTYSILNRNSGKALDISAGSTSAGALSVQNTNSGAASQKWVITGTSTGYTLKNVNSSLLLDVDHGYTTDGAAVLQWSDNGGSNQRWTLVDEGGGFYEFLNGNSGKALDVSGGSTADGASILQWTDHQGTNQQWSLVPLN